MELRHYSQEKALSNRDLCRPTGRMDQTDYMLKNEESFITPALSDLRLSSNLRVPRIVMELRELSCCRAVDPGGYEAASSNASLPGQMPGCVDAQPTRRRRVTSADGWPCSTFRAALSPVFGLGQWASAPLDRRAPDGPGPPPGPTRRAEPISIPIVRTNFI